MRVGIIGAGGIAREHYRGYRRLEGVQLVGVADPSAEARERAAAQWSLPAFAVVDEFLEQAKPEAVSVCTPPKFHEDAVVKCLEAGVAVLCEKPMARDLCAAVRIVEATERTGTPLMVAFCHRFHPPVMMVRDAIAAGKIGRVLMFRNRFGGKQDMSNRWFSDPEIAGGGCLMDTSVHSVDLFRFLVGDATWVDAATADLSGRYRLEDSGILTLGTADGAFGTIEGSWSTPFSANVIEVYGSEGAAVIDYNTGETRIISAGDAEWTKLTWEGPDRFEREVEAFIASLCSSAPAPITARDGLAANKILDAAYRSADQGLRIPIA